MSAKIRRSPTHLDVIVGDEVVSAVKVWQPWIRTLHWTLVGCVTTLSITGFYIGNPVLSGDARVNLMSMARLTHYVAAWVFVCVLVGRVFLAFTGNPWARWDQLVPIRPERRAAFVDSLRYYLFLRREPAEVVGHNPMAGLSYLGLFGMFVVQTVTGIALIAATDRGRGWEWFLTGWFYQWVSVPQMRFFHHIIMWLTWTFVVFHVYAATLTDRVEHGGEVSSMLGGWKLLPTARVEEDLRRDAERRRRRYTRKP